MFSGKDRKDRSPFAGQRRRKGKFNRRLLPALAVVALVGLFLFGQMENSDVAAWLSLRSDQEELESAVERLEESNATLERQLEELASDPQALEKLARERHNMRLPEEEVLTVIDKRETADGNDK